MKKGFVKLYRDYGDRIWSSDPNTISVLVHCLWMANYREQSFNGRVIPVGSFVTSLDAMERHTGVTKRGIRTALKRLKDDTIIDIETTQRYTIISVLNYSAINDDENEERHKGDTISDTKTTQKRHKNDTTSDTKVTLIKEQEYIEQDKDNIIPPISPQRGEQCNLFSENEYSGESKKKTRKRFSPPTIQEVEEYCKERNNGISAESFVAFYESKGWKVGNSPMKDWKAAIITWEKRNSNNTNYGTRQITTADERRTIIRSTEKPGADF